MHGADAIAQAADGIVQVRPHRCAAMMLLLLMLLLLRLETDAAQVAQCVMVLAQQQTAIHNGRCRRRRQTCRQIKATLTKPIAERRDLQMRLLMVRIVLLLLLLMRLHVLLLLQLLLQMMLLLMLMQLHVQCVKTVVVGCRTH